MGENRLPNRALRSDGDIVSHCLHAWNTLIDRSNQLARTLARN